MHLTIDINLDGSAFDDEAGDAKVRDGRAVAAVLVDLAKLVDGSLLGVGSRRLALDVHGNAVGLLAVRRGKAKARL